MHISTLTKKFTKRTEGQQVTIIKAWSVVDAHNVVIIALRQLWIAYRGFACGIRASQVTRRHGDRSITAPSPTRVPHEFSVLLAECVTAMCAQHMDHI